MSDINVTCKICGNTAKFIFAKTLIFKHEASYFQCEICGFLQTEEPYWLSEAYQSSLNATDTGLVARPLSVSRIAENFIMDYFDPYGRFVDYGGGNGIFVRMMRDKGFNFYRYDKYAQNIYALYFDISNLPKEDHKFELVTSFEVLEHFEDPLQEFEEMFSLSKSVLCSTFLYSPSVAADLQNWWYLGEMHGQHISFYTEKAIKIIAERFGCYYHSNNVDLHLLTPKKLRHPVFQNPSNDNLTNKLCKIIFLVTNRAQKLLWDSKARVHPESLTMKDAEWVKQQLINGDKR